METTDISVRRTQMPLLDEVAAEKKRKSGDDDPHIRLYYSPDDDNPPMPSVTTVKDLRVSPEKDETINGWRQRYDGKSSYARPWWNDQMAYKGHRGTIIHFVILSGLDTDEHAASGDTHFHRVGDDDWGREEYESEYALKKWSKKAPSANTDEIGFQPRNNQYDGIHAWDKAAREMKWAARAFKTRMIDGVVDSAVYTRHENDASVDGRLAEATILGLEDFVYNTEYGYGGQYDLLYQTADDRVVLSDLKTSSGVRFDHKLQSAAYKLAVESATDYEIDETEIIRVNPDYEEVEVSRSTQWDRSLEGLGHQFLALADKARVSYQQTIQAAAEQLESSVSESEPRRSPANGS